MSLAEELTTKVYATMPASMPCNSVFALALVNEALERAAQECENGNEGEGIVQYIGAGFAVRIRALKGKP